MKQLYLAAAHGAPVMPRGVRSNAARAASSDARVTPLPLRHRTPRVLPTVRCRYAEPERHPQASSSSVETTDADAEDSAAAAPNPLEQLRATQDPQERARLLRALDGKWSAHQARYAPSAAERAISEELGTAPATVMLFALQTPALQRLDVARQLRPALRSLKAALDDESPQDAYFVVTRRPDLLEHPLPLQRFLDLLGAQQVGARATVTFLLAAPPELLANGTLHAAGAVAAWLRGLGVRPEFLWGRVLCAAPGVLLKSPEADLQPLASYLMSLGLSARQLSQLFVLLPELLLATVDGELRPFVSYMRSLGASARQAGEVLLAAPRLALRGAEGAKAALAPRLAALAAYGIEADGVAAMLREGGDDGDGDEDGAAGGTSTGTASSSGRGSGGDASSSSGRGSGGSSPSSGRSINISPSEGAPIGGAADGAAGAACDGAPRLRPRTAFLTEKGAPGEALEALAALGYSHAQIRALLAACPQIAAEPGLELRRRVAFLEEALVMRREAALACPEFLAASLMQTVGPRHAFAEERQLAGRVAGPDGCWDLKALATGADVAFVEALGGSINEYGSFRARFEVRGEKGVCFACFGGVAAAGPGRGRRKGGFGRERTRMTASSDVKTAAAPPLLTATHMHNDKHNKTKGRVLVQAVGRRRRRVPGGAAQARHLRGPVRASETHRWLDVWRIACAGRTLTQSPPATAVLPNGARARRRRRLYPTLSCPLR